MNTGGYRGGTSEHFLLGYSSQKNLEHFTVYKRSPGKAGWARLRSKQRKGSGAPIQPGGLRPQTKPVLSWSVGALEELPLACTLPSRPLSPPSPGHSGCEGRGAM